jgi:signal peptidase I
LNRAIREVLDWVIIIAVAFGASYALRHWVVQPYRIQMSSMETTVFPNDLVMVDKLSYHFHQPRRGDVIIFWPPGITTGDPYIKRVIGLPGETVEAKDGKIYVNGKAADEPYLHGYVMPDFSPTPVPQGQLFVMGDNRAVSLDSRSFGTVSTSSIIGRGMFAYWPLKHFVVLRAQTGLAQ